MSVTKINTKQLGSNELVFTEGNLLAGNNIEIAEVLPEGGIDNHTLACLHFDGDTNNAAGDNLKLNYPNSWESTTSNPKFGTGKLDTSAVLDISKYNLTDKTSFTLDFWLDKPESTPEIYFGLASGTGGWGYKPTRETTFIIWYNFGVHNKLWVKNSTGEKIVDVPAIENWNTSTYKHFALTYDGTEGKASFFIDGVLKTSVTFESTVNKNLTSLYIYSSDEVRLSDIVRYKENFVPPTKPYSLAIPTGNKVVNNTITKTSQLTNDSGFITDVPVATTTVAGKVKPDGTTITVTEDGTISAVAGGSTGGTTDYNDLTNKPTIGGVSLEGDVSLTDLGINLDGYALKTEIPTKTSQLSNDSGFITRSAKASSTQYGTVKLEYNSSTKTLNIVV